MISLSDLKTLELDADGMRKRFDRPREELNEKEKRLVDRWAYRAQMGRDWNLRNYKLYAGIDRAWNINFFQSTQSMTYLIKDLVNGKTESQQFEICKRFGMTHLMPREVDLKTGASLNTRRLNMPVMFEVVFSLARSSTLQKAGRLLNERLEQTPLFQFEPALLTMRNKAKAEAVNQWVERQNRELHYNQTVRQATTYCARYGHQLVFPREEWYESPDYNHGVQKGRCGLRFDTPHPSRSAWDLSCPAWTLNSGSGCTWANYWKIATWGEVRYTDQWWNIDRVRAREDNLTHGFGIYSGAWGDFFDVTNHCRMSGGIALTGSWFSEEDRQRIIDAGLFYSRGPDEMPVWITEHFEVINPRIDLDKSLPSVNIWYRVVLASDDTPIYVGPFNDRAVSAFLWEPDDNNAVQCSHTLEAIQYQDHASNIISQAILTARQNLRNLTLYDNTVIPEEKMRELVAMPNEAHYRNANYLPFDGSRIRNLLNQHNWDSSDVVKPVVFPSQDWGGHILLLKQLLEFHQLAQTTSAEEQGGSQSHEQKVAEIEVRRQGTAQRLGLQAFDIDKGMTAMSGVIYTQGVERQQDSELVIVDPHLSDEALTSYGFSAIEREAPGQEYNQRGSVLASIQPDQMRVEQWADQKSLQRTPYNSMGQYFIQMVSSLAKALPVPEVIRLVNLSLDLMQLPKDIRLEVPEGAGQDEVMKLIQEQLVPQIVQFVDRRVPQIIQGMVGGAGGAPQGPVPGANGNGMPAAPPGLAAPQAPMPMPMPAMPDPAMMMAQQPQPEAPPMPMPPPPPVPIPMPGPEGPVPPPSQAPVLPGEIEEPEPVEYPIS